MVPTCHGIAYPKVRSFHWGTFLQGFGKMCIFASSKKINHTQKKEQNHEKD
jgi:hypothetical protein